MASEPTDSKQPLPPYPAFQSVKSGIAVFKEHVIPNRVDRSVWGNKYSGSVATQVQTAFKFLRLIDGDGVPTDRLRTLVGALDTEQWGPKLRLVIEESYAPIFTLDLEKVTVTQFFERFRAVYGAEGETARKCVTFFLNAAREAGIKVSPFLESGAKPRGSPGKRKTRSKKEGEDIVPEGQSAKLPPPPPPASDMTDRLLSKFPEFDPEWPDDIKTKWFAGFAELMARTKPN